MDSEGLSRRSKGQAPVLYDYRLYIRNLMHLRRSPIKCLVRRAHAQEPPGAWRAGVTRKQLPTDVTIASGSGSLLRVQSRLMEPLLAVSALHPVP